jgi:hypothetical protein
MPATPANALNISSAGIVVFDGTATFSADTVTQHDVLVGGASNAITSVAPSATSGVPLVSGGASADPSFTTAVVAGGGTGVASFTDTNSLVISGTTSTGALQDVASVATGQVLTSAGTSTAPAWSNAPSVTSITLGGGTALGAYVVGTWTPTVTGSSTAGTTSYSIQSGNYVQIGKLVYVSFRIQCTSGNTAAGNLTLGALPFTATNTSALDQNLGPFGSANGNVSFSAGYTYAHWSLAHNTTTGTIQEQGSGKTVASFAIVASTAYDFYGSGCYQTA